MPCKEEENKRSTVKNLFGNRFFVTSFLRMTVVSLLIIPYSLFIVNRSFRHSFQRLLSTPAAGYRNGTGALANVGTNGYAWSSSSYVADGSNAYNAGMLNFNSTNVNPLNNGNRAIARAVRCVQHLRGCFLFR